MSSLRFFRSAAVAALAVTATLSAAALAQDAPAAPEVPAGMDAGAAYNAARNQLGVLGYCEEQGHIDGTAAEVQAKFIAMVPAGDAAEGDAAEELGKTGTVSAMGMEKTLADAAKEQNTTEEALCKQMDTMIQQMATQLPKQ